MDKKTYACLGFIAGALLGFSGIKTISYMSEPVKLYSGGVPFFYVVKDRNGKMTTLILEKKVLYKNQNPFQKPTKPKRLEEINSPELQELKIQPSRIKDPNNLKKSKPGKLNIEIGPTNSYSKKSYSKKSYSKKSYSNVNQ